MDRFNPNQSQFYLPEIEKYEENVFWFFLDPILGVATSSNPGNRPTKQKCQRGNSIVVSTSRCGREDPSSTLGYPILFLKILLLSLLLLLACWHIIAIQPNAAHTQWGEMESRHFHRSPCCCSFVVVAAVRCWLIIWKWGSRKYREPSYNVGAVDHLVDRPLSMREARGSKPRSSTPIFIFISILFVLFSFWWN